MSGYLCEKEILSSTINTNVDARSMSLDIHYLMNLKSFPLAVDRLLSYVSDLEKITILMHSLARRLATTELKLSKKQGQS